MPVLALVCLLGALTGCQSGGYGLTGALWDDAHAHHYCLAADNANLVLFDAGRDILVQYNELNEKQDTITRRAYYLASNDRWIVEGKQPVFENLSKPIRLSPVPSATALEAAAQADTPLCVVENKEARQFTVYRFGKVAGIHDLPFYPCKSGVMTRVALTPLAVAGDITIAGCVVGCIGLSQCADPCDSTESPARSPVMASNDRDPKRNHHAKR